MGVKYYNDLYEIDDRTRRMKYYSLVVKSIENDMNRWTLKITSDGISRYVSPDYNGNKFAIEYRKFATFAYIIHKSALIPDRELELIVENINGGELGKLFEKLTETVFTEDIYEIEKSIGNGDRKEKLKFLEVSQIKDQIEETYNDWLENENIMNAKLIAKLIFSYRKNEEVYNLWLEKFDNEIIIDELNKLD